MKRALVSLSFLGLGLLAGACSAEPAPCFEGPSITLDLTAIGAATGAPIAGAELCATHPRSCSCTRASASGRASLEVPAEADVGLRFSHESHYAIALQLTSGTEDLGGRVPMLTHSDTELVSLFTGMNLDPERGTVLILPTAVGGADIVEGLEYRLVAEDGEEFIPIYFDGSGIPSLSSTSTLPSGRAIFWMIEPGRYRFHSCLLRACAVISGWSSGGGLEAVEPWVEIEVEANTGLVLLLSACTRDRLLACEEGLP